MTDQLMEIMIQTPGTIYNPQIKDQDGTVIYDGFTVIHAMELWYDWFVEIRVWNTDPDWMVFFGLWDHYNKMHLADLQRLYAASYGQYDPLSNYDMMEHNFDGRKLDKTTETTTPEGKTTTTATITGKLTDTTTQYKTGLGSGGTETITDKFVTDNTSGSGNDTRKTTTDLTYEAGTKTTRDDTPDNTKSGSFNGETLTGYHEIYERHTMRKGNIGVQSAQDLIEKEVNVRKYNLLVEYVKQFFQLYGYYTGGVS